MDQVELSMLVDIGLKFYAVPCITTNLSDIEVNVFGHRFSGKAQVRRATLSCDSSYSLCVRPSVVCLSVRHKSCPLYNSKTIRDISMKLGTLIKHNRMTCHDGQNHNSCLHILGVIAL